MVLEDPTLVVPFPVVPELLSPVILEVLPQPMVLEDPTLVVPNTVVLKDPTPVVPEDPSSVVLSPVVLEKLSLGVPDPVDLKDLSSVVSSLMVPARPAVPEPPTFPVTAKGSILSILPYTYYIGPATLGAVLFMGLHSLTCLSQPARA